MDCGGGKTEIFIFHGSLRVQDCRLEWFSSWKGAEKLLQATLKDLLRHVTLGTVWTHGDDPFSSSKFFGDLQRSCNIGSTAGAGEHAFAARKLTHHGESGFVVNHHDLV